MRLPLGIRELNTGYVFASVWMRPNEVTYYIRRQFGPGWAQATRAHADDDLFHRFEFVIDGTGGAEWRRDGALQLTVTDLNYQVVEQTYVAFRAPPGSAAASSAGFVDNVLVSRR